MPATTAVATQELPDHSASLPIILVVDDDADILESIKEMVLQSLQGIHVTTAASAEEGLKALTERFGSLPVAVIISDFKMPGINGLEFLERAREIAPESTRILITAFPDLKVATEAIEEAGISNYFVKPFDPGQLLDAVQVALHGHASRHLVERNIRKAFHSAEGDRPPSSP